MICANSYEGEMYGEYVWQAWGPEEGTACSTAGKLCKFSNAQIDSDTWYEHALCGDSGWITKSSICGNGSCGTCPATLPQAGGACEEASETAELTYSHCAYATDNCGPSISSLDCDNGQWAIADTCP